ncbi:putative UbiA family prenyltransferase [Hypomontagnella submonticulosa]|nr:putative UbiA family prenyltransferase [Hypomontagnella submonticulosa]
MSTTRTSENTVINFFPDLPGYRNPTTGIISQIPVSWVPYYQLMRLDRPAGLYAFYFPYLIGLAYAACVAITPPNPSEVAKISALLLPFNILLRGVACTWNDTVDQHFDRRVPRTRHRPIARGAVSTAQAHTFTLAQIGLLSLFYVFRLLSPDLVPNTTSAVVLFIVYALMKRVTNYPQVVLGVAFSWAVFFATRVFEVNEESVQRSTLALFGSIVCWVITYDTNYAHQDVAYDEKAGVKSMALRFRHSTKQLTSALSAVQVGLLALCGYWAGFGVVYFVVTVGGVAVALAFYIYQVDLTRPESCSMWFHRQFWLVGVTCMSGFLGEYISRLEY